MSQADYGTLKWTVKFYNYFFQFPCDDSWLAVASAGVGLVWTLGREVQALSWQAAIQCEKLEAATYIGTQTEEEQLTSKAKQKL